MITITITRSLIYIIYVIVLKGYANINDMFAKKNKKKNMKIHLHTINYISI